MIARRGSSHSISGEGIENKNWLLSSIKNGGVYKNWSTPPFFGIPAIGLIIAR
jgi:hypothetical protein